jgi:hypothetical protein
VSSTFLYPDKLAAERRCKVLLSQNGTERERDPIYSELASGCNFIKLRIVTRSWPLEGKMLLEELLDSVRAA